MASIKPFAALRPKPELASRICELPYDVMSSDEARALAAGNPLSFLHVSKPEIDLPPSVDLYDPGVYAKGRESFQKLIAEGALRQDAVPCFYIYRQVMGQHAQVGLVAAASCQEYLDGIIKKHELTRPDKEDDRVRHIETLNSQTGPVFLAYRAHPSVDALIAGITAFAPDTDFTAPDGVRHSAWTVSSAVSPAVEVAFSLVPCLYIADGHHRSAAAARVFQSRKGAGQSARFLSVIFPHDQMQILPYNRVLKDLNGHTAAQLLEKLDGIFVLQKNSGEAKPVRKHQLGLFLEGAWHTLTFREHFFRTKDPIEKLDVTLLQKFVLAPLFGIEDPRTSKRISFVGGIRGTAELEKLVRAGEAVCAFSMFPTSIEDLMTIADAGGIMPPKSTWFEPKLRDAMFCHML
jgi:uncharacterized protein (DUF1015 family)